MIPNAETDWPWKLELRAKDGTVRAYALIDEDTPAAIRGKRWHLNCGGYVVRALWRPATRNYGLLYLHRMILDLPTGDPREGDHRDGDRLDNRRANLRIVTRAVQQQNVSSHRDSTSPHRGVSWDKSRGKWVASAKPPGGKFRRLGRFDDEDEAARVAAEFRREHMPFAVAR